MGGRGVRGTGAPQCARLRHGTHQLHHPGPARLRRPRAAAAGARARRHRASRCSSPTPACAPPACSTAPLAALGGRAARGLRRDAVEPDRGAPCAPPPSVYLAEGCDGLVAIGGGSSIDLAKGVAIAATHPGPLKTYATIEGGSPRISERVAPLIAVPTTAGTGSEVARGAIVIVDDGRKLGFHSWHLVPKTALCDPELTLGLPPFLTAATGMDAIAHCMETFMAPAVNPPADGIALDGLERAWAHIERATRDGSDREARFNMMSASMQGAMAFQKGLGCVHSLSHSLGGADPKLHHGTLNAMFLPAVVTLQRERAESIVEGAAPRAHGARDGRCRRRARRRGRRGRRGDPRP